MTSIEAIKQDLDKLNSEQLWIRLAKPQLPKLPKESLSSSCNYWESRYLNLEFKN
jgi:hypothetical protein